MVHLRATRKVLRFLGPESPSNGDPDSALGDWFVNRFVLDRQPLLVLVSSASLLPILEPAREVRALPERLASIVRRRLRELGVAEPLIWAELATMNEILVAPTNDRSVVGTMVDFVRMARYYRPPGDRWDRAGLSALEAALENTPCRVTGPESGTVFPAERARELLANACDVRAPSSRSDGYGQGPCIEVHVTSCRDADRRITRISARRQQALSRRLHRQVRQLEASRGRNPLIR